MPYGVRAAQGKVTATALVPGRLTQQSQRCTRTGRQAHQLPRHRPPAHRHRRGPRGPTVIITNDNDITTKALTGQYARRIPIEQRLAEIIQGFCPDALSSAVNLNVDLDVVLCVLAQALTAALRMRLPGNYGNATPTPSSGASSKPPGEIISDPAGITIKINRRAYSLVLRHTDLPRPPPSPGGTDAASTSSSPNPWAEVLVRKSVDLGSGAARASLCKGKEVLRGRAGSRSRGRRPDQASCFLLTRFWAIEVFSPSPGMITHAAR